jgi:hypothetical protein
MGVEQFPARLRLVSDNTKATDDGPLVQCAMWLAMYAHALPEGFPREAALEFLSDARAAMPHLSRMLTPPCLHGGDAA